MVPDLTTCMVLSRSWSDSTDQNVSVSTSEHVLFYFRSRHYHYKYYRPPLNSCIIIIHFSLNMTVPLGWLVQLSYETIAISLTLQQKYHEIYLKVDAYNIIKKWKLFMSIDLYTLRLICQIFQIWRFHLMERYIDIFRDTNRHFIFRFSTVCLRKWSGDMADSCLSTKLCIDWLNWQFPRQPELYGPRRQTTDARAIAEALLNSQTELKHSPYQSYLIRS